MGNRKILLPVIWTIELFIVILLFYICPDSLDAEKQKCYMVLCLQLLVIWGILVFTSSRYGIDLIEPITFLTAIHILMFEITPIICLLTEDILWFEQDLWGGCVKGTWISTLGYICIVFSYYSRFRNKKPLHSDNSYESGSIHCYETSNKTNILIVNLLIWIIAFASNVFLIMTSGNSMFYILTLGMGANATHSASSANVEFLGIIAYMMVPSFLYIFELSKNIALKIILLYLMASTFIIRGFRFILIAVILAPLIYICVKKKIRPRLWQILPVFFVIAVMIGFVGLARTDLRAGNGLDDLSLSSLSYQIVYDMIIENFSIVKTYYGIVENIPAHMGYTFGQQMILYTLIMFIPRAIWPQKPQPILRKVISTSVSPYAAVAGTAYPYIGEFYHEFGIMGVIVFCYLIGKICGNLKSKMMKNDIHSNVLYATMLPLLFQVLIRGYTPSNFFMLLSVSIPIIISRRSESNAKGRLQ